METEIMKIAMSNGIWAVLSIFLIMYILKVQEKRDIKQEKREENYILLINSLTDRMELINNINIDIKEIKELVTKKDI